ncbi:MAG: peptidoglycan DD-metalloendopeptidase family protein [Candidatus Woesebacteria bacterium]
MADSASSLPRSSQNSSVDELSAAVVQLNQYWQEINAFVLKHFDRNVALSNAYKSTKLTEAPLSWVNGVKIWKEEYLRPSDPPLVPETDEEVVFQAVAQIIQTTELKTIADSFNKAVAFARGLMDRGSELQYISDILQNIQARKDTEDEWPAYPLFTAIAAKMVMDTTANIMEKVKKIDPNAAQALEKERPASEKNDDDDSYEGTSHVLAGQADTPVQSAPGSSEDSVTANQVAEARDRVSGQVEDLRKAGSLLIYSYDRPVDSDELQSKLAALGIDSSTNAELLKDLMGVYKTYSEEKWGAAKPITIEQTQTLREMLSQNSGQRAFIQKQIEGAALFAALSLEVNSQTGPDEKLTASVIEEIAARYGDIGKEILASEDARRELQSLFSQKKIDYQRQIKALTGKNIFFDGPQSTETLSSLLRIIQEGKSFDGMTPEQAIMTLFGTKTQVRAEVERVKKQEEKHKAQILATFHGAVNPNTSPQAENTGAPSAKESAAKIINEMWPYIYTTNKKSLSEMLEQHRRDIIKMAGRELTPGEADKLMRSVEQGLAGDFAAFKAEMRMNRANAWTEEIQNKLTDGYPEGTYVVQQFGSNPQETRIVSRVTDEVPFADDGQIITITAGGGELQQESALRDPAPRGAWGRLQGLIPGRKKNDIAKANSIVRLVRSPATIAAGIGIGGTAAFIAGIIGHSAPLIIGGAVTAGAGIGFLIGGPVGALVGGVIGGGIGFLTNNAVQASLGGGLPTAPAGINFSTFGASAGQGMASGIGVNSNILVNSIASGTAKAAGIGITNASAALGAFSSAPLSVPVAVIVPTLFGGMAVVALTVGGMIVPGAFLSSGDVIPQGPKYFSITKVATPDVSEDPVNVLYTITIKPKDGYTVNINDVTDAITYTRKEGAPQAPQKNADQSKLDTLKGTVNSDQEKKTEYTISFTGPGEVILFDDTLVTNTLKVSYTAIKGGETVNDSFTVTEGVVFGNPPVLACWPATGTIIQGPWGPYSHSNVDAIDIHGDLNSDIVSPFGGSVTFYTQDMTGGGGCVYGNHAIVNTNQGFQLLYGHMTEFEAPFQGGQTYQIQPGTKIGHMGFTSCDPKFNVVGNQHLHYEYRPSASKGVSSKLEGILPGAPASINYSSPWIVTGNQHVEIGQCSTGISTPIQGKVRATIACLQIVDGAKAWSDSELAQYKTEMTAMMDNSLIQQAMCKNGQTIKIVRYDPDPSSTTEGCAIKTPGQGGAEVISATEIAVCDLMFSNPTRFGRSTMWHEPGHILQQKYSNWSTIFPDYGSQSEGYISTYPLTKTKTEDFAEAFGLCNATKSGPGYRDDPQASYTQYPDHCGKINTFLQSAGQ